jgi:hypothetical protein
MVTNNFGNKSFMKSMRRLSTHPLWGRRGGARRDLFAFALFPLPSAQCSEKIDDGPIHIAPLKTYIICEHTPYELII